MDYSLAYDYLQSLTMPQTANYILPTSSFMFLFQKPLKLFFNGQKNMLGMEGEGKEGGKGRKGEEGGRKGEK